MSAAGLHASPLRAAPSPASHPSQDEASYLSPSIHTAQPPSPVEATPRDAPKASAHSPPNGARLALGPVRCLSFTRCLVVFSTLQTSPLTSFHDVVPWPGLYGGGFFVVQSLSCVRLFATP